MHLRETGERCFPWLLGSQGCEQFFRKIRTNASKGTAFPNLTAKDIVLFAKTFAKLSDATAAASAEEKKSYGDDVLLATREHKGFVCDLTDDDLKTVIEQAKVLAEDDAKKLGMKALSFHPQNLIPRPRKTRRKVNIPNPHLPPNLPEIPHKDEPNSKYVTFADGTKMKKHCFLHKMNKFHLPNKKMSRDRVMRVRSDDWLSFSDEFFIEEDNQSDVETESEEEE
jgi:hypothetical protein